MEYRKLPHGNEMLSVVGIGLGGIQKNSDEEITKIITTAVNNGINFFDLCGGARNIYKPFGDATKNCRDKVFIQVHFGAVYKENGEYSWSRDLSLIKKTFSEELQDLQTDYVDFGFLHCVDEMNDYDEIVKSGLIEYLKQLKEEGVVHHIGFSSHTPLVANKLLDSGLIDMMLFSINPAYDMEQGDEYGIGSYQERQELFQRASSLGVGISVMKPFLGGRLLNAEASPFKHQLTHYQCIQYALDRPSVLSVVPGVQSFNELEKLLGFVDATNDEKDYSVISKFTKASSLGECVYCNHCQPCPVDIDIALVNKYYDLSRHGDELALQHYKKLKINASDCIECGHCESHCPFKVKQPERMKKIKEYFS